MTTLTDFRKSIIKKFRKNSQKFEGIQDLLVIRFDLCFQPVIEEIRAGANIIDQKL